MPKCNALPQEGKPTEIPLDRERLAKQIGELLARSWLRRQFPRENNKASDFKDAPE